MNMKSDHECDDYYDDMIYDMITFEVDDSFIELDGPAKECTLCGLHLFYREGVWCEKDDDGSFMPDWGLTWIYMNILRNRQSITLNIY